MKPVHALFTALVFITIIPATAEEEKAQALSLIHISEPTRPY